ncbi:hypothetical protein AGDE_01576 [Angomonas deanei]|uniref:Uncharacterized protein n=1 Tax=Angomonas deanei TaxID=59799 RepID=S9VA12_9TRYP|nr:hypothetical protein AGDE_06089 [Angomonas deanei]EPY42347.1 hypothetical protein AGDE_01576 [Angomonas deanei]CAD2213366.1 hypothetical protein, conserved [Angomonas deanei]|eukprot:EPY37844.1 hypothetical protein AGDE_06089 [Angomonas deanei]
MAGVESPQDAVRSTAQMTEQMKDQMERSRKNPGQELGLSADEVARRKAEASKPRSFVSGETKREFEVKSSSRAQQIMNRGLDRSLREKRLSEFRKNTRLLRKVQIGLGIFTLIFLLYMGREFLLPHYAAVQQRNKILQIRAERAKERMEEYAREHGISEDQPIELHGGVARVIKNDGKPKAIE